ncbi:hypothetical protein KDL45_12920 [bacterium]|nr:hypothetical protein [bacterium]
MRYAPVGMLCGLIALAAAGCGSAPDEFAGEGGIFDSPVDVVVNGNAAYVMNANFDLSDEKDGAITVVDIPACLINRKECIVRRVETPAFIGEMVINQDGTAGYLANRRGDTVLLVDLSDPWTPEIVDLDPDKDGDQGIKVGVEPFGLSLSPDETTLYVTNVGSGDLSVVDLDTEELVKNELLASGISEVEIQPGSDYAYITNKGRISVTVFDIESNRLVTALPFGSFLTGVGTDTRGIAFSPDGTTGFIASRNPDSLLVIDTTKIPENVDQSVIDLVATGNGPSGVSVTPDGAEVWITNYSSNNVFAYDAETREVLEVVSAGLGPNALAMAAPVEQDPEHYFILVTNFLSHNVSLLDARAKEYIWAIP